MWNKIKTFLSDKKNGLKTPLKRSELVNINFRFLSENGNDKCLVQVKWATLPLDKVTSLIFGVMMGMFNNNVLNAIEQHNTEESKLISNKIQELLKTLENIDYKDDDLSMGDLELDEDGFL